MERTMDSRDTVGSRLGSRLSDPGSGRLEHILTRGLALAALSFALSPIPAPAQQPSAQTAAQEPIQVLLVTKGHNFDRAPFFEMFDALGRTFNWTHVEQPAAQLFWDPVNAA